MDRAPRSGPAPSSPGSPSCPAGWPVASPSCSTSRSRPTCCPRQHCCCWFSASSWCSRRSRHRLRRSPARRSAIVGQQLMWVVIGLPAMYVASRLPAKPGAGSRTRRCSARSRCWCSWSFPARVEVNGNRNWLDFGGPFRLQPSEVAKLALGLCGRRPAGPQAEAADQWKHLLVPIAAGGVRHPRPGPGWRTTSAPRSSWSRHARVCSSSPAPRCGCSCCSAVWPLRGDVSVGAATHRSSRITDWLHPDQADPLDGGLQALHGKFALGSRRLVGRRPRRRRRSGAACPRRTPTSSSRSSARSSGWSARSPCSPCSACSATPGCGSPCGDRPVRPARGRRGHRLDHRCRRWSTSARSSACCPSPACRCRWCPTADRRCSSRCSRSAC